MHEAQPQTDDRHLHTKHHPTTTGRMMARRMDNTTTTEPSHQRHHRRALGTSTATPLQTTTTKATHTGTVAGDQGDRTSSVDAHRDTHSTAAPPNHLANAVDDLKSFESAPISTSITAGRLHRRVICSECPQG
jgi:hypothetical protein